MLGLGFEISRMASQEIARCRRLSQDVARCRKVSQGDAKGSQAVEGRRMVSQGCVTRCHSRRRKVVLATVETSIFS